MFVLGIKIFGVDRCGAILYVRGGTEIRAVQGLDFGKKPLTDRAKHNFAATQDPMNLPAFLFANWVRYAIHEPDDKSPANPGDLDTLYTTAPIVIIPAANLRGVGIALDAFPVGAAIGEDMTLNLGEVYYCAFRRFQHN